MYFIGLDVHKKTISYCVKDAAGGVHQEGKIGSTRGGLHGWIRSMPQPRTIAMEATIFTESGESQLKHNRHKRPIASHSERVFVRAKLLDPLAPKPHQSCARTNEPC
jgi:hypothetical protein